MVFLSLMQGCIALAKTFNNEDKNMTREEICKDKQESF